MMLAISRNKDPKASPPYLSQYHLSRAPFSSGVSVFYADPDREQALDMLQHLTQYSEEILFLTGPEGVGKSSLLEQYIDRAEEHWRVCRLNGGDSFEAERLFQHIAECFQLDTSMLRPEALLQGLQQQLGELQEQQLPVLIIDDAQKLTDDALEIVMHLAMLEGEHGRLVRVLLCGDNSLGARFAAERFSGIPQPHRLELKPLDELLTGPYLIARMEAAGYRGDPLFSDREIRQIHRLSRGLPGRVNDEAHELLMHRSGPRRGVAAATAGHYVKVGLAATAIVGSVLGLHERINALLGGDERAMTVSAPERPVMRLAEQGNPWAVVIRDGERIQISCGAPASDTVGVRPVVAAAAMVQQGASAMGPLLEDVSPVPAQEQPSPAAEASVQDDVETPSQVSATPLVVAEAPASGGQPPLVVKPEEQPVENVTAAGERTEETEAPAGPVELKLTDVTPAPVVGSDESQRIVVNGSGFVDGSKVAVSRAGKVEVLPDDKITLLDDSRLAIEVATGVQPQSWAIQVSTPDNRRSNVLRFQVVAPPKEEKPEVEAGGEAAPAAPEVIASERPETPEGDTPSADKAVKPEPAPGPAPAVKPQPAKKTVEQAAKPGSEGRLLGTDWLAGQPKGNFTLQLLASSDPESVRQFASQPGLPAPLAQFTMERNGKGLHVLTQGSYPSRADAERAAAGLPKGLRPWIRTLESVQQVMTPTPKPAANAEVSFPPAGSGIKDTAWVWSQDPGRYTIQLAAAESEQAIEAAMRRIALPGELVVVQTLREGKPWYALIYGSFATRDAARGTISRLPEALRRSGPWPRSFSSMHDELSRSTPAR